MLARLFAQSRARPALDSNKRLPEEEEQRYNPGDEIPVESRAVKVLRRVN